MVMWGSGHFVTLNVIFNRSRILRVVRAGSFRPTGFAGIESRYGGTQQEKKQATFQTAKRIIFMWPSLNKDYFLL
jgi:hypothetical protein